MISVSNSNLIDSEGFSPGIDMIGDVKEYMKDKYGERLPNITGSFVELYFDSVGDCVDATEYVTTPDKPGAWITYYAYDGKIIDAITVGCKRSFAGDRSIYELWI